MQPLGSSSSSSSAAAPNTTWDAKTKKFECTSENAGSLVRLVHESTPLIADLNAIITSYLDADENAIHSRIAKLNANPLVLENEESLNEYSKAICTYARTKDNSILSHLSHRVLAFFIEKRARIHLLLTLLIMSKTAFFDECSIEELIDYLKHPSEISDGAYTNSIVEALLKADGQKIKQMTVAQIAEVTKAIEKNYSCCRASDVKQAMINELVGNDMAKLKACPIDELLALLASSFPFYQHQSAAKLIFHYLKDEVLKNEAQKLKEISQNPIAFNSLIHKICRYVGNNELAPFVTVVEKQLLQDEAKLLDKMPVFSERIEIVHIMQERGLASETLLSAEKKKFVDTQSSASDTR